MSKGWKTATLDEIRKASVLAIITENSRFKDRISQVALETQVLYKLFMFNPELDCILEELLAEGWISKRGDYYKVGELNRNIDLELFVTRCIDR